MIAEAPCSSVTARLREVQRCVGEQLRFPGVTDDPYLAGVVAAKMGLAEFLLDTRVSLRVDNRTVDWGLGERRRVFCEGVADAGLCSLADVAWSIRAIWQMRPEATQAMVVEVMGWEYWGEVLAAILDARRPLYESFRLLRRTEKGDSDGSRAGSCVQDIGRPVLCEQE